MLLGLAVIGAWAQDDHPAPNSEHGNTSTVAPAPSDQKVSVSMSTVSPSPGYVIGIDDVLHIAVWREPDLTATLPVRSDGMISLPLLNDVQAAGLTPMQLSALLREKLKKYVATPNVTVVVTQANSRRVYVFGEVSHTGPIALLHDMTVMQALSTVGFTEFARTKGIYILRKDKDNGHEEKIRFNYKRAIKGDAAALSVLLQPGDMIVVP